MNNIESSTKICIMIVEDEKPIREILIKFLSKNGFNVLSAENGLEALETLESIDYKVDLVLSDVMMPKMTGIELINSLMSKAESLKYLLTSGFCDDQDIENLNRKYFIRKPYQLSSLLQKIQDIILE